MSWRQGHVETHRYMCFTTLLMLVVDCLKIWLLTISPSSGQACRSSVSFPFESGLAYWPVLTNRMQWKRHCDLQYLRGLAASVNPLGIQPPCKEIQVRLDERSGENDGESSVSHRWRSTRHENEVIMETQPIPGFPAKHIHMNDLVSTTCPKRTVRQSPANSEIHEK